ncbi:MAG: hypothetical protein OEM99_12555 [Gammaproteobacteria bacterium]|nr:hypothetical protein [Gammaproteobacteria bacterium]
MTDSDTPLRVALREAQAGVENAGVPQFDRVWAAANARTQSLRRKRRVVAGSVAAAAVAAIAFGLLMPREVELRFVDEDELLGTTSWFAPSDGLLPEYQFDIYQEIPVLIESTETFGGALL